jgi:hypothetical protein
VGAVEDAIADGIRDGGVGEEVVPPLVFELTGDDRGTKAVAVFEDLEEVATGILGKRRDGEVVQDKDVHLRDASEQTWIRSVGAREPELVEETRDTSVEYPEAFAASLVSEGAGEIAFAGTGRASHIVPIYRFVRPSTIGGTRCTVGRYG